VLTIEPQARQAFVERAASRIAVAHANVGVDLVVAVESSKPLARELSELVASKLNVPVVTLAKATTMADVEPEQEMLDRYDVWEKNVAPTSWDTVLKARAQGRKTNTDAESFNEYTSNMLQHLIDDREHMASNATKKKATSIAASLPPYRRQFHNLFKKVDVGVSQRLLLVDDNVAGGSTMKHAVERLTKVGMDTKNILVAVATDYPSPSRK
jgi:adenine/guanine phosphoribosyltransferase-like PRPP-binding protein